MIFCRVACCLSYNLDTLLSPLKTVHSVFIRSPNDPNCFFEEYIKFESFVFGTTSDEIPSHIGSMLPFKFSLVSEKVCFFFKKNSVGTEEYVLPAVSTVWLILRGVAMFTLWIICCSSDTIWDE